MHRGRGTRMMGGNRVNRSHSTMGLGTTLKKISKKVGVKPCAGCDNRADALDKMLPSRQRK